MRSIFAQPDADRTRAQFEQVLDHLETRFPHAAELLANAGEELLAFTVFPELVWRQIRSNNPFSNDSTRKSAVAPTWSASSRIAQP